MKRLLCRNEMPFTPSFVGSEEMDLMVIYWAWCGVDSWLLRSSAPHGCSNSKGQSLQPLGIGG